MACSFNQHEIYSSSSVGDDDSTSGYCCDGVESMSSRLVEILNTMPISHSCTSTCLRPPKSPKARQGRIELPSCTEMTKMVWNSCTTGLMTETKASSTRKKWKSLQNGEPHKGVETLMRQSRGCLLPLRSSDIIILVSTKG